MALSSYNHLLKQVESLKTENSHLRRELQDNSSHLTKLENEASNMKDVLSHLQQTMEDEGDDNLQSAGDQLGGAVESDAGGADDSLGGGECFCCCYVRACVHVYICVCVRVHVYICVCVSLCVDETLQSKGCESCVCVCHCVC